jgi:nucleotide-binding universal stress UspA family protein
MLKNRFKRILVALDGSANSIRGMNEPISLARQSEAIVTGIHVLPGFPSELTRTLNGYKKYLLEKTRKFLYDGKPSFAEYF